MIKIALKNIKLLAFLNKLPILNYFFILKIDKNFASIRTNAVLEKFYTDIYAQNKTSKRTADKRFADIDKITLKYLSPVNKNTIHDIAVSSGITSDNLYELLQKNNIPFGLDISDKYALIYVKEGFISKIFDADKNLFFAYLGNLFAGDKNIFFPITVFLYKLIKKLNNTTDFDYSLYLFHPDVLKKINEKKINIVEYDIFKTPLNDKYTFVRCMNILNKGYFSDKELITGIKNIKNSLKENGVFLIGRTNSKGINNVSFFKKTESGFVCLEDVNQGSEVKNLVLKA